jgi:dynamin 1-like protein
MASLGEDLLVTVNKLQDLVFNTIGNDSLDLPQIVSSFGQSPCSLGDESHRGCRLG